MLGSNSANRLFRVGDWVEVRPFREILKTLDANGRLEGLPFMPEMVGYCGRRFRVVKSAHKTCDPTGQTNLRRMPDVVHLSTRCDGSAHDGCDARCLLFWKTAWLRPACGPAERASPDVPVKPEDVELERLRADTRYMPSDDSGIRYRCQATEIPRASTALSSRNVGQYALDLVSGNVTPERFVGLFVLAVWSSAVRKFARIFGRAHKSQSIASPAPDEATRLAKVHSFGPGEFVQVRAVRDIALTLDRDGKNRGLYFEREMERYSGKSFRVDYRPTQIIDERTGRKIRLGSDCIVLEGLVCAGLDNPGRLFCPRSCYFYWREAWLRSASSGKTAEM